jgi:predicted CopG family antitoxin
MYVKHMKWISLRIETFEELSELRGSEETWDDIVKELIKAKQLQNRRELLKRTNNDNFVPLEQV